MAAPRRHYSEEFKRRVVERINGDPNQIAALANELGLDRTLLYRWHKRYATPPTSPSPLGRRGQGMRAGAGGGVDEASGMRATEVDLQQALLDAAFALIAAIREATDSAPLNQLSAALGLVIDRLLKLKAAHSTATAATEEVIQIAYLYPDGSEHASPPWAEGDPAFEEPIQRGRVRSPFWED